jgi:iduronate 2-sulfatase
MPAEGPVTEQQARELIRGYYAATSYTDAQIGRVLATLDQLGLREKTIIILWGDHGWQLGEHGMWCKHTNFETSTHSTLMISLPKQATAGSRTEALTEFVDIYPTLVELAGLPQLEGLEGISFVPLIRDPKRSWKSAAFSQYPRGKLMGHAMRTERYRFVEWCEPGKEPAGLELYDHQVDPDENVNVANQPENKELVAKLSNQLHAGWKQALPPK